MDASKLLLDYLYILNIKECGQEVIRLINYILRYKAILIKPEDPIYVDIVAPEVAGCVCNLLDVQMQELSN